MLSYFASVFTQRKTKRLYHDRNCKCECEGKKVLLHQHRTISLRFQLLFIPKRIKTKMLIHLENDNVILFNHPCKEQGDWSKSHAHVLFTKFGHNNETAFHAFFVSLLLVYEFCSCLCVCRDLLMNKFGFHLAIHTGRKKLKTNYRR